ncbi:phosphoglycerate mutase-like protein [Daldinia loculata]|uniref:phosphoglycerate mutase-like protein n=1 Tax=Daldinia loculata TaxID=103429 RepID=UPI0020C4065A|nr:phosphoglycerate mutase-like protein [Daldinia loculata]KAI1645414.1 phosphoglycerate mutase-like protein [Daldinia loculata]
MTSLIPRPPYTEDELKTLYPENLQLQLVQILLRHGERSPVSVRFQNTGLPAFWPYCSAVHQLKSAVLDRHTGQFSTFEWKRRLEAFGPNDEPVLAQGPAGEFDGVCEMGMLTDRGRETTFDLGTRLRTLYVDQLRFLPPVLLSADSLYLRATPIPRALDSVQETFTGLYPSHTRAPKFPPPAILTRAPGDETLFPNDSNCRRFAALSRAFAQRTAERWNDTEEMAYLSKLYGKWMPEDSPRVAVDGRPRLSGIMDTINSTLAHGPETRLPKEFYDPKGREIIEKIGVEEWFAGYKESQEYRALGIGGLLGDVVSRMVGSAERSTADGEYEVARKLESGPVTEGKGATPIRFGLSGCHDTTLAGVLASLGAYESDKWPPYTSHIAIEMFRKADTTRSKPANPYQHGAATVPPAETGPAQASKPGWFGSLFSSTRAKPGSPPPGIGRKRSEELSAEERAKLEEYYVRIRYNDEVVTVPGCRTPGNHLEGDESFCTLTAFKAIVDKFVPRNWKQQCRNNIRGPAFPEKPEPAGY